MAKRGKFVAFDGMDGSGKGTQVKLLVEKLFDLDKRNHILLTREPYNSVYYDEIRELLRNGKKPKDNAEKMAELFVKDREFHCGLIGKLLIDGVYVISDRYKYSTLAYQWAQGIDIYKLIKMHDEPEIIVPDLTIIIDLPAEVALERIAKDGIRTHKEVFEKLEFQKKLRENFLKLPKLLPQENIVIVDGNKNEEEVFEEIKNRVVHDFGIVPF